MTADLDLPVALEILCEDPVKRERYANDSFFEAGLRAYHRSDTAFDLLVGRSAVVVFTPGCLAAGQLGAGLETLRVAGYEPVYARLFRFSQREVTDVWRYQLDTFTPERWKLIVGVLLAGPSLLLVLRRRRVDATGADGSACAHVKALKGPSDPVLARPDQLRRALGGMNKIINLVHSSEEPADALRESAILLPPAELDAAWAAVRGAAAPPSLDALELGAPVARWGGMSFAHAAVALRARLAEGLRGPLGPKASAALAERVADEIAWARRTSWERPIEALKDVTSSSAPLASLIRVADAGQAAFAAAALGELDAALLTGRCDLANLWASCDEARLYVDPWERLIVATQIVTTALRDAPSPRA